LDVLFLVRVESDFVLFLGETIVQSDARFTSNNLIYWLLIVEPF
jgi:hypothetical protein